MNWQQQFSRIKTLTANGSGFNAGHVVQHSPAARSPPTVVNTQKILNRLSRRLSQTGEGQTEYILIAALIVVVLIVAYGSFGDKVREQVAYQTSEIAGTSDEKKGGASGSSQYSSKNPTSNDGKEGKDTPGGGAGVGAGTGSGGSSGGGSGGTGGSGSSGSSGGGSGGTGGSGSSGSSGGGSGNTGGSGSSGSSGGGSGGTGVHSPPGGPGNPTPPVPPIPTPPPTATPTPTPTPPPAVASPPAPEPSVWTRTCYGMHQGMIPIYPPRPVEIDCGTQVPLVGYPKDALPINGESFKDQYGNVKRAPVIEYDYCLRFGGACIGCMNTPVQCSSDSWSWQKCNQYGECRYIISPVYPRFGY